MSPAFAFGLAIIAIPLSVWLWERAIEALIRKHRKGELVGDVVWSIVVLYLLAVALGLVYRLWR